MPEYLPAAPLRQAVEEWIAAGNSLDVHLNASDARRCRYLLAGQPTCTVEVVERILLAIGAEWRMVELYPPPPKVGRAGYQWPSPHPLRKLDERQVLAAHRLHIDGGLSIRELGRQLHGRLGYSSPKSCTMALCSAFKRAGLPRRDRIAASVLVSTTHGHGARADKAAYKRWHRAEFGPWPSDRA